MTTKNFLLFQAGKQGGSGANAKAIFKTELATSGEETVYDPNGEDDVTVTLPSSQYEDLTSEDPEAGPSDATFKLVKSEEGYMLRVSYNGGMVYFKVVADPATEEYVTDELSKLKIPNISVVGKNPSGQNGVVWNGHSAGRLLPEDLFTAENDGKVFVIRNYGGTFYLVAEDFLTADDIEDLAHKSLMVSIGVDEDYGYTSQYTFDEVSAAITDGRLVFASLRMDSYQVVRHSPTEIVFATYRDPASTIDTITLRRDNSVTVKTTDLGSGGVLKAVFGETTYAEVADAINNGKMVYVERSNNLFVAMSKTSGRIIFESLTFDGSVNILRLELSSTNNWGQFAAQLARQDAVPTKVSDLENDEGYVKEDALPTKTSDLQNDSGFIGAAELEAMADKQIAITTPPGSIQQSYNFAQGRYDENTTTLHGYLFAVPNEVLIKEDETKITVLCTSIPHNALSVGIFEYDFNGNEGRGSTTWLCDTGSVNLVLGENRLPVKYIKRNTPTQPVIKLEPSKVYYACLMIGPTKSGFDSRDVTLASSNSVVYVNQSNPALVLSSIVESGEVDWTVGTMENTWFKGYLQADGPMPYMMIRNGEGLPVVITDPFDNLESWNLFNTYRVSNIFNMANFGTRPAVYQKIIPKKNVNVKKITYVDYHASIKAVNAPAIVDNNYNILVDRSGYVVTQGDNDGTKLGQFYLHELTLNEPFTMLKDTPYWVPAGLNISNGTNDWVVTYQNPDDLRRDLFICVDDGLIAPASGAMERAYDQYAPFCRIVTDGNVEYTF